MGKLICGCGYLGLRVAKRWLSRGETVHATTRSEQRAAELNAFGIEPIVTDVTRDVKLPGSGNDIDTVLFALGFDRSVGQTIEEVYLQGLQNVLNASSQRWQRFIYISSTGVYEQTDGQWVDETTPCQPVRAGGRACLQAEQRLANSPLASRRIILRLAGLYGPGRLPKLAAVQAGLPIDAVANGYLNLIHVDDVADIVASVDEYVVSPETLVISDGHPVLRGDFYRELARLLNAPPPQFVSPPSSSGGAERGLTDKRVSNRKFLSLYPRPLRYPTYREGLAEIVATGY
jgi:nucleoside-diphosphate-sugar epimerase